MTPVALSAGFGSDLAYEVGAIASYTAVALVLIALGFVALDATTPGALNQLVRVGAPNAVVISAFGVFSIAGIVASSVLASTGSLGEGLLRTLVFGVLGILFQVVAVRLLVAMLRLDVGTILTSDELSATAFVAGVSELAVALVVSVALF